MNCSLLNHKSPLFRASTAITCQQSPCAGRGRCDPFTLKQLLSCVSVRIPKAPRDFVLKASSPKQFRLREPSERYKGGKKPPVKSMMHLKGGLHQKHLLLQQRELTWAHSAVLLLKKALAVKQWRELIFFICSLLFLGRIDGCFGQNRLKGGFVSQDD